MNLSAVRTTFGIVDNINTLVKTSMGIYKAVQQLRTLNSP